MYGRLRRTRSILGGNMIDLQQLELLLNCPGICEDWNLSYGVTEPRKKAFLDTKHRDSFFNPTSETALTLFMLGNIDGWKQIETLNTSPRTNSGWNNVFFDMLRNNQSVFNISKSSGLWRDLFNEKIRCDPVEFQKSILLFEFEIMNSAFHTINHKPFKELSFSKIKGKTGWGQFDAVLIIPTEKLFIFFESKLTSDISKTTRGYPYINQLMRNLESMFLLTTHENSIYKNWNFKYVFICPRKSIHYKSTYYAYVLEFITEQLSMFKEILKNESQVNENNFETYFESFEKDISNHIFTIYWDTFGKIIQKNNSSFFNTYFNNLCKSGFLQTNQIKSIRERFLIAGIEI
jgi:hypothetical protein